MEKNSYNCLLDKIDDSYSVGVHGVALLKNYLLGADMAFKDGLHFQAGGGLLENLQMYGQKRHFNSFLLDKISNYTYIDKYQKDIVNIIVAIPEVLVDGDDTYFLGHYNYSELLNTSNVEEKFFPVNMLSDIERTLPKEFVYGCTYKNIFSNDGEIKFKLNPNFIDFISEDKRKKFIHKYVSNLKIKCGLKTIEQEKDIIENLKKYNFYYESEYNRQFLDYIYKDKIKTK